jgi:hypothetical protein
MCRTLERYALTLSTWARWAGPNPAVVTEGGDFWLSKLNRDRNPDASSETGFCALAVGREEVALSFGSGAGLAKGIVSARDGRMSLLSTRSAAVANSQTNTLWRMPAITLSVAGIENP